MSTVQAVLGPTAVAEFPAVSVAVAAAKEMLSMPSPVMVSIVTVRVLVPLPEMEKVPSAVPVLWRVTSADWSVTSSAPL